MVQPTKSVRGSRSTAAKGGAKTPDETADDSAAGPGVARYTWSEIRAAVEPATEAELAVYTVRASEPELVAKGSQLRSEKILSDLRVWLGQIIDWRRRAKTLPMGFSDARLRVLAHHAFALRELNDKINSRLSVKADHAEAVAIASAAYRAAQRDRKLLRAVLDQAAVVAEGFAAKVSAVDAPASSPDALVRSLEALIEVAHAELTQDTAVGKILRADNMTEDALVKFTEVVRVLQGSHDATRGAAGLGPVTQSQLDYQDGVCLTHMTALRVLFRELRESDRTIPVLIPRATARVLRVRTRKSSTEKKPSEPSPNQG